LLQDLDGDHTAAIDALGAIHGAHGPFAERCKQAIAAVEDSSDQRIHRSFAARVPGRRSNGTLLSRWPPRSMASIQTGAANGNKRSVDHEIPLIPFIDLLLCCVMFLLVTAVWNQLRSLPVSTPGAMDEQTTLNETLRVRVTADRYLIVETSC